MEFKIGSKVRVKKISNLHAMDDFYKEKFSKYIDHTGTIKDIFHNNDKDCCVTMDSYIANELLCKNVYFDFGELEFIIERFESKEVFGCGGETI